MWNFQENNKFKKFIQSRPILVILAILVIFFTWKIVILSLKLQETYKNKELEQQKIFDLQQRKEKLSKDIEKLNTEKGKEEAIRENFGMVKEGEQVIIIIDDKDTKQIEKIQKNGGLINFFKNLFSK